MFESLTLEKRNTDLQLEHLAGILGVQRVTTAP